VVLPTPSGVIVPSPVTTTLDAFLTGLMVNNSLRRSTAGADDV
jgi:hypothetical protein